MALTATKLHLSNKSKNEECDLDVSLAVLGSRAGVGIIYIVKVKELYAYKSCLSRTSSLKTGNRTH